MLELRPNCECCDRDLPPESLEARICSFECTFCRSCAETVLGGHCPNCGGELVRPPVRPEGKLAKFYENACLLDQGFVKNPDLKVLAHVGSVGKQLGDERDVAGHHRHCRCGHGRQLHRGGPGLCRFGRLGGRFADGLSKASLAIETQKRPCIDLTERLLIDLKPAF